MANHSLQRNTTSSLPLFSASECIPILIAFGMESVAIGTLNALTIIVYLKEYSLRERSMYLVINLAFVDMLVAGCTITECWFVRRFHLDVSATVGSVCEFSWYYYISFDILNF